MTNSEAINPTTPAIAREDAVRVVSLDVNVVQFDRIIETVRGLRSAGGGYVCFSTVHMVMESHDHPEYGDKVNAANLVIPDGMPLVWMQKISGRKDATRVRANDLMTGLCEYAAANNMTVGFYGGTQAVIDGIRERIAKDLPGLSVTYAYSPPFRPLTDDEDAEVVARINEADPDILFMGLGCPKQENWMADHRERLSCVMLGVGASFDFYAGNVRECPPWLGHLGLEWLFRLTQEPKRLWRRYLILNPRFMALAAAQLLGLRRSGQ